MKFKNYNCLFTFAAVIECGDKLPNLCNTVSAKQLTSFCLIEFNFKNCLQSCKKCQEHKISTLNDAPEIGTCSDKLPFVCETVKENQLASFCAIAFNAKNCKKTCEQCSKDGKFTSKHSSKQFGDGNCDDQLPGLCSTVQADQLDSFCSIDFNAKNCKKTCNHCQKTNAMLKPQDTQSKASKNDCDDQLPTSCNAVHEKQLEAFCAIDFNSKHCEKTCNACQGNQISTEKENLELSTGINIPYKNSKYILGMTFF